MKKYVSIYNTPEYRKKYTGIYGSWYAMKQRCGNKNNLAFKNYGGRGITFCNKWIDFIGFKEDMENSYKKGLTLERINNEDNYYKENCEWATRLKQCRNKRNNVVLEFKGQKKTISEWSKIIKIKQKTLSARYCSGWSIENILSPKLEKPVRGGKTNHF